MSKSFVLDALKYVLAIGVLTYVVWMMWGDPVAKHVALGIDPKATATGTVVNHAEGQLRLEEQGKGKVAEFGLVEGKSTVELPAGASFLAPGTVVSVWEAPGGLGYVWRKHVVNREPADVTAFILAGLLFTSAALLTFVRWYVLVRAVGLPFALPDALRLGMVGLFCSTFMPGSIGGDVVKAVFIAREQSRRAVAVATVIIDRVLALVGLFWFVAVLGAIFWAAGYLQGGAERALQSIVLGAAGVSVVTVVFWIVLGLLSPDRANGWAEWLDGIPKIGHAAAEFWRAVWIYRQRPGSMALAMAIALVGHVGFVLTFYFAARTLGDPGLKIPTALQHFLIVPIGMVIQAVPLFPGGAGIGEAGFGGLYALLGCDAASGVLGSLVQRLWLVLVGLVGALLYIRMRPALKPAKEPPAELAPAPAQA